MTQNEFFNILMDELKNLPESKLYEITSYYQTYILTKLTSGQSENEIIDKLGDPKLIADRLIKEINLDRPLNFEREMYTSFNSLDNKKEISNSNTNFEVKKNKFNVNALLKLGISILLVLLFLPSIINISLLLLYICKICIQIIMKNLNLCYSENLNFFFHSPLVISDFILSLPTTSLILFSIGTIFLSLFFMLIIFYFFKFLFINFKNLLFTIKEKEA